MHIWVSIALHIRPKYVDSRILRRRSPCAMFHVNVKDVLMLKKYVADNPDVRSQDPRIHSPPTSNGNFRELQHSLFFTFRMNLRASLLGQSCLTSINSKLILLRLTRGWLVSQNGCYLWVSVKRQNDHHSTKDVDAVANSHGYSIIKQVYEHTANSNSLSTD